MVETRDIAKETLEILECFNSDYKSKISKQFIKSLKELADASEIEVKVDPNKKLKEQEISEESKDFIALIYYTYIVDKNEKEKILKIWKENDSLFQDELKQKYDMNKIFEERKKEKTQTNVKDVKLPILVKKNIFKKILDNIKKFLKK